MPSAWHDAMTELFRDDPRLAIEIPRECGVGLPGDLSASCDSREFNDR
jgi:hypothetical protein